MFLRSGPLKSQLKFSKFMKSNYTDQYSKIGRGMVQYLKLVLSNFLFKDFRNCKEKNVLKFYEWLNSKIKNSC